MKTQQHNRAAFFRNSAIGIVFAASSVTAIPAQAGWFSNVSNKVQNVTSQVAATPGNIEAKVKDISAKINEIFHKIEEGGPLVQKIKQIHLKESIMDIVDYIRDSRSDYDQFANSEAEYFRGDLKSMITNFSSINDTFLHRDSMAEQQSNVERMLDKLPISFLYLVHKSIGPALQDIQTKLGIINSQAQIMSTVPSVSASMQNPQAFIDQVCDKNTHKGMKTSFREALAIIKVAASQIEMWGEHFKDLAPRDMSVAADAIGEGGGATLTAHPAHKFLVRAFFPAKVVKEVVEDYKTLADGLCGN